LSAEEEPPYQFIVEVEIHGYAKTLVIGYTATDGGQSWTYENVPSGTHTYTFTLYPEYDYPPQEFFAEAWGPYGAHDRDECEAQLYYTNYLELWLGEYPIGPPLPIIE
ncbi:MAG: hypothetical protein ACP5EQ_07610, partial [Candidatus Cloacimonadia bacterium]